MILVNAILLLLLFYYEYRMNRLEREMQTGIKPPTEYEVLGFLVNNVDYVRVDRQEDCDLIIHTAPEAFLSYQPPDGNTKPILFFWLTDHDPSEPISLPPNVYLYRTSNRRSIASDQDRVMPYIWESVRLPFYVLPRGERPRVGFCGAAWPGLRSELLQAFRDHPEIETDAIERQGFWGGAPNDDQLRLEFEQNIQANHFTLACRGKGNFSMRFYQVLSAGRIPILIDTDTILPFEEEIEWETIIVKAATCREAVEKTLHFYRTRNIEATQKRCFDVYRQYFEARTYLRRVLFSHVGH